MKIYNKIVLVVMALSFTLSGYASKELPDFEDYANYLQIEIETESSVITIEHGFRTSEELFAHNTFDLLSSISLVDEFCTVSITVKVRVGVDSNFIEVSATVSDIPCADVAAVAKRTIAQLKAGIQ